MHIHLKRNEADSIKGILILLIVLGHILTLNFNFGTKDFRTYLYTFHVMCFFALPLFYKTKNSFSFRKIGDIVLRSWVPYLWILAVCAFSYAFIKQRPFWGPESLPALLNGTQTPLAECFGYVFPWFLPAYCSFSIMLMFARKFKVVLWLFTIASVATFFFTYDQYYAFKMSLPFALGLAICYFSLGVIAFYGNKLWEGCKYIGALLFVVLSVCWWIGIALPEFFFKFLPITFFMLLLCLISDIDCKFLRLLGKNSLGIYLFNVFFANMSYMLLPHTWYVGVVTFIASVLIPCAMTICINKIPVIGDILFPRSLKKSFGI